MLLNSALHPAGDDVDDEGDSEGFAKVACSCTVLGGVDVPVMMAATAADLFCTPELRLLDGRCRDRLRFNIDEVFSLPALSVLSVLFPPKNPGRRRMVVLRFGFTGAASTAFASQAVFVGEPTGDLALPAESGSILVPKG